MNPATPAQTPPQVPTVDGCQTLQEYAANLLRFALNHGVQAMDGEQLRWTDSMAQLTVCRLPAEMTETDRHLDRQINQLRHDIAKEQTRRAQTWARIAAQLAGLETDPDHDHDIPDAPDAPEETDADRAAKLLRAALMLIMGPQPPTNGGGGRRAPLQPPPNPKPTGTQVDSQGTDARARAAAQTLQATRPTPPAPRVRPDDIPF